MFYKLSDADQFPDAEWSSKMGYEERTTDYCPINENHKGVRRKETLRIILPNRFGNLVWTWYSECLVDRKVADAFSKAGLTGYRLTPVIIDGIKGKRQEVPQLWELVVRGKGGFAHAKSGIKLKYQCEACKLADYTDYGKGLYVDESQWDGSDIFFVWPLPSFIIVTEKVKNVLDENKFTNYKLIKTEDLVGEGEKGNLGPGLYPDWW